MCLAHTDFVNGYNYLTTYLAWVLHIHLHTAYTITTLARERKYNQSEECDFEGAFPIASYSYT